MAQRDFLLGSMREALLGLDGERPASAEPAPTKLASTVMLVRDDEGPLEVFMLRRVSSMAFAPSMHVFPGGGVDRRDAEDEVPWAGPSVEEWAETLDTDEASARMLVAAAVREIFEETGVLLASPVSDESQAPELDRDVAADLRARLVAHEIGFGQVLLEHHLVLRSDLLRYRAHWITPEVEPRRYDTRFFIAAVPEGQDPDGDTSEADHCEWLRPDAAVGAFEDGDLMLMPPTLVCLEQLAEVSTVSAALAQAIAIVPVMPQLVQTEAGPAMRAQLP
ncbi:NUDIX hydrolase [Janibacter limosus]|jgi:8-oxo-dGTP pyrophosphatase MutT (NUDIX family)|uniref:NUDIX hydrolase n=1 Tax=Janibacter limosus TaxID=53458 RepID=A0A4P6MQ20_9MICO|nr:NUDIX hydrolase [Janibacter limosus]QBF45019.1 NUDIX hydrolase [Janibacter limosus]